MKKPLLSAGAAVVGAGLALGAISLISKREEPTTQVAEQEEVWQSRVVPKEQFAKVGQLNSGEFDLFTFQPKPGEGVSDASNRFDAWDLTKGDRYKDIHQQT